jgi:hypothetical protein
MKRLILAVLAAGMLSVCGGVGTAEAQVPHRQMRTWSRSLERDFRQWNRASHRELRRAHWRVERDMRRIYRRFGRGQMRVWVMPQGPRMRF